MHSVTALGGVSKKLWDQLANVSMPLSKGRIFPVSIFSKLLLVIPFVAALNNGSTRCRVFTKPTLTALIFHAISSFDFDILFICLESDRTSRCDEINISA